MLPGRPDRVRIVKSAPPDVLSVEPGSVMAGQAPPSPSPTLGASLHEAEVRQVVLPIADHDSRGRTGDVESLTSDALVRFPIRAVGQRWTMMRALVCRLIGQGYSDPMIREVVGHWYNHYQELGRVRTSRPESDREMEAVIRGTRANPKFSRSTSGADHRARCRAISLNEGLIRFLRSGAFLALDERRSPPEGGAESNGSAPGTTCMLGYNQDLPSHPPQAPIKRVTLPSLRRRGRRLRDREFAFVEAILILAEYKRQTGEYGRDGVIRMTDQQITDIAAERHPEVRWVSNQQIEREKRKFIGRLGDGKPATKFELLREVRKGCRGSIRAGAH